MWKFRNFSFVFLLAVSSHAAVLTCSFDGTPTSPCIPLSLTPVTQINEEISVSGAPFSPYTDNITEILNLNPNEGLSADIQEFPRNIFGIFTNVQTFYATGISMTELGTDSFYNCQNLSSIYMYSNTFGRIGARIASTCNFVRILHFGDSQIESIDEDAFEGLLALSQLYIYNTSLTCIPPKLFQPLKIIDDMNLSYNKITALHSQTFADLTRLYYVELSHNQIAYIPNFNLNSTGTQSSSGENIYLLIYDNPIQAIYPLLMTNLFSGRFAANSAYLTIDLQKFDESLNTCMDPNDMNLNPTGFAGNLYNIGQNADWILQNTTFQLSTTCYKAFTAEMESDSLVTCAIKTTTTLAPSSDGQCATDKICRYYLDWNYLSFIDSDIARVYFINSHLNLVPKVLFENS